MATYPCLSVPVPETCRARARATRHGHGIQLVQPVVFLTLHEYTQVWAETRSYTDRSARGADGLYREAQTTREVPQ